MRVRAADAADAPAGGGGISHQRHAVVRATEPGAGDADVLVDPSFAEQFAVSSPSRRYAAVLRALPPVLVLSEARVRPLVEALGAELARAFREAGRDMPPWRRPAALLSKWRPRSFADVPVDARLPEDEVERRLAEAAA